MDEIWKDIKGCEGKYKISNKGRVLSTIRKKHKILKHDIHFGMTKKGYCRVKLYDLNKTRFSIFVHRLMAIHFIPNDNPMAFQVNHKDGDTKNNCVENLEWATPSDNMFHSYREGLR